LAKTNLLPLLAILQSLAMGKTFGSLPSRNKKMRLRITRQMGTRCPEKKSRKNQAVRTGKKNRLHNIEVSKKDGKSQLILFGIFKI